MQPLQIYFNQKEYKNGSEISPFALIRQPTINFDFNPKRLYTIIMIDRDAPMVDNPYNKYWLHWMIINTFKVVADYVPPAPLEDTGLHRYYILIFEQLDKITVPMYQKRPLFNLLDFWVKYNLILRGGYCFKSQYKTLL